MPPLETRLCVVDPPKVECGFFVGMGVAQRADDRIDRIIVADHLHPKFIDSFELVVLADEGPASVNGQELSGPPDLPGATSVMADPSGAGVEDRLLDGLDVRLRDVEAKGIQSGSPRRPAGRGPTLSCPDPNWKVARSSTCANPNRPGTGHPAFPLTRSRVYHNAVETELARWVVLDGCRAEPVVVEERREDVTGRTAKRLR